MTPQRFAELRAQFHALLELDPAARPARLAQIAATDAALRVELDRLLDNLTPADLDAPQAPAQLGAFRLVRRIGRGGMGEVFLAERVDGGFAQRVALKRLRAGSLPAELKRRFLRERQLLARLDHPGIARLIDGGVTPHGEPWLAMEYVDGSPIDAWAASRSLDLRARVALVRRVCAAVAFAHGNLVVHRDIKPANVLVGADGEPKLLDFGIAKLLDDGDAEATRTVLRAMTPRYAAPEQILGDRTTTATDVYALGVLLFELATGRSPYARAAAGEGDWAHGALVEAPSRLSDGLASRAERRRAAGDLDRIVAKALAKSPADRYAGASALGDDLDDWLAGLAPRSGIGSTSALTRQLLRRYRWPLALAGAVLVTLAAGAAVALAQARKAADQARIAQANLAAMLGVLSAANPQKFAGREPNAGEFLKAAAERLEAEYAQQPALIGNALGEIGHGLLNLGHARDAEPVLEAAAAAIDRDPQASDRRKFGTWKLLVFAQDARDTAQRALATAKRIEALAQSPAPDALAAAIDALGSAAGVLSKHGMDDDAARLFERGQALLRETPGDVTASARESFWRQYAWSALRAHSPRRATEALAQSLRAMDESPGNFSTLRRAEAHRLQAEAAIASGDAPAARASFDLAAPVLRAEYPAGHPQRAELDVLGARLHVLEGDAAAALALAAQAMPHLGVPDDADKDRLQGNVVIARAQASLGACDAARAALADARRLRDALVPLLPRERAAVESAESDLALRCD